MKKIIHALLLMLIVGGFAAHAQSSLQPQHLTCEYESNPLGIDSHTPRLSWTFTSSERNQFQTGYEIEVSDDPKIPKGNSWTTGKIADSNSLQIEYNGADLRPFTRYFWRVRTYDKHDQPSTWSTTAWFETAMLRSSDWSAKWISDGGKQPEHDEDFYKEDRMPLFQKTIALKKKMLSARLYVSGIGYYEAQVNGKKVGKNMLDPGWTSYKNEVLYVVHDITSHLKQGDNALGFMLGNGWWNPLPLKLFGRFNLRDVQQTGRPCVKAEVHIRYSDGSTDIVVTDDTWKTAPGPVIRNSVYLGEHYDARLEQRGWATSNVKLSSWKNATIVEGPAGKLRVQMQPPIQTSMTVKPISIKEISPGIFIADMGQNFAGVAHIRVRGKAGTKISMRYGEALLPDGTLNYLTTVAGQIKEIWNLKGGAGSPPTAWQEDSYILKGSGEEAWSPRFTFHGFRFVEITGWPGKPTLDDISGLKMHSTVSRAGTFSCSNEMFNNVHQVADWTFLSNIFSVQSDCPGREKMGYGADIVTTANTFMYNYNMSNFYSKAVLDFASEQQPDGGITEIAPYTGIHDKGLGGESGPLGWELAFPYLQQQLYEFYGDKRIIETHYPAVVKQIDFLKTKAIDGLFYWDISDHEALDPKPEALSASAFYYHHVLLASEFAGILGKKDDSLTYAKLGEQIKNQIRAKYLIPNTGRFDNGTQSAQLFALWYNLTPEKEKSMKVLMDEFERHHWHVSSGIFGIRMMFEVLRKNDQAEVAYTIANQKDYPGWGYMLSKGATTLWETWEYPDNAPSQNHPMFGSIDEWFYRSVLGINSLEPGFRKIRIKPQPAGDLTWAKGSYEAVSGMIGTEWKIENKRFKLAVSIPPNTRAEIWIPNNSKGDVTEGGKPLSSHSEIKAIRKTDKYTVVETGSGAYQFESVF